MRAMKDSGVEWIGEIPEGWKIHRVKNNFRIIAGSGFKPELQGNSNDEIPVCKASDINNSLHRLYKSSNYIDATTMECEGFTLIPIGSVLFAKIGEAMKKNNRTLCMVNCCADNNCQGLVPVDADSNFSYYLFTCIDMNWFDNAGTIPCINNQKLLALKIPYPPVLIQTRIADYLDVKCAEIDALIAEKERSNALLKEQRQSIIYEAVTKGLDPDTPMKGSGIEWIGEIPQGWETRKVKFCFKIIAGATPKSGNEEYWDGEIAWITPADYTTEDVYVSGGHKSISQAGLESCATSLIPIGSIIFSKRAPIGLVAINNTELCTNQGCLSCVPCEDTNVKFYYYSMSVFTEQFDLFGSGTTFKEISADDFANFFLPYPNRVIQDNITDHLDTKCAEIDALIAANSITIQKLKEYRQSVIYEAVTGKTEI